MQPNKNASDFARELHDDFGQRLALLSVGFETLYHESSMNAKLFHRGLRKLANDVKELAADLHDVSHRLHSSKLRLLGLEAALKDVCRQVSFQHKIDIRLEAGEIPSRLSEDVSLCFYRVAQEGINNAVKHSHSNRIDVRFGNRGGHVWMKIKDFGVGFDPHSRVDGIGLAAMRERLRMVGGSLQVKSSPGAGTELTAEAKIMMTVNSCHAA